MGVDLCTYRVRVGRFACSGRVKRTCTIVWLRPASVCAKICVAGRLSLVLFCVAHLLLRAGDVELNPGPDKVDQLLTIVRDMVASSEKFQKDILGKVKDVQTNITEIKRRLSKIEGSSGTDEVVQMLKDTHNKLESIESRQSQHSTLVVDDLNNRMRRNNLIFKGIVEQDSETWQETEGLVNEFVSKNLGIAAGEIERAHRIGQKRPGYTRPIIVKFLNFKEKN